jgi:hypothetical protein
MAAFPDRAELLQAQSYGFDDPEEFDAKTSDADVKADIMQEALSEDANSFITVHRILSAGNMPEEFIGRYPVDKYDYGQLLDILATQYGGGDYRIRLYVKGRLKKGGNKLVPIASAIKKESQQPSGASEAAGILSTVLDRLETNNARMMQMMQQQITVRPSGDNEEAFLNKMLLYKQLFAQEPRSAGGFADILATVEGLKTLGIQIGNQEESDGSFTKIAAQFAPIAVAMLNNVQSHPVPNQPVQPVSSTTTVNRRRKVNPDPKVVNPKPQSEEEKMQLAIKMGVAHLIKLAQTNTDPGTAAETVLANMTEEQALAVFSQPDTLEKLIHIDRRVDPHQDWFIDLGEHIKAILGLDSTVSDQYSDLPDDSESDTVTDTTQLDE